jgi:hypothetical protein
MTHQLVPVKGLMFGAKDAFVCHRRRLQFALRAAQAQHCAVKHVRYGRQTSAEFVESLEHLCVVLFSYAILVYLFAFFPR